MPRLEMEVRGMDCAEEVALLRSAVGKLPGIRDLGFDVLGHRLTVDFEDGLVSQGAILAAVAGTGLRATPAGTGGLAAVPARDHKRTAATALSGCALLAGFAWHAVDAGFLGALGAHDTVALPFPAQGLYAATAVLGAWFVLPKAWGALKRLRPDMNLLMVVAVAGAAAIGEWLEAATVAFLFAVSLALESWSVGRARRAINALMSLTPPKARVVGADGREESVPAEDVAPGTRILVKPGERIPLDGHVAAGTSSVNQAPITGESVPVAKGTGDPVLAGTINLDGALEVVTAKAASDTVLAHIVQLVRDAQLQRSRSERWVESFAHWYTPAVMLLALLVVLVPPMCGGAWSFWLYQGLALLVVACPCALVISTPVSIVAGIAAAARGGVLIKGGEFLEAAARLRAVALDKTGTITAGMPRVTRVVAMPEHDERAVLEIAAGIEASSEHPIARAIVRHAADLGVAAPAAAGYQSISGRGAAARLCGRPVWVGSHRHLEERGEETPALRQLAEELASQGHTVVFVGDDGHVCGVVTVADAVRPGSKAAIAELRALGIEHVVMLTGDNRPTAEAIAGQVAVTEVRSELLPAEKLAAVEALVARYGAVAMVGDGVNDAPALARATLGIAMGAAGTDAALETADVALMTDDLGRLPWLVRLARRTMATIRQNVAASLLGKAVFLVLAVFGHASLWAAIAADMGISLLVVGNSLRLLRPR